MAASDDRSRGSETTPQTGASGVSAAPFALSPTSHAAFAERGTLVLTATAGDAAEAWRLELRSLADELAHLAGERGDPRSIRGVFRVSPRATAVARSLAPVASVLLGAPCVVTKGTFFDKTPDGNWLVPWHQDRTIVVDRLAELPGYGDWGERDGLIQVRPPAEVLERTVALRIHCDRCDGSNGALRVVPGSHSRGILDEAAVERTVAEGTEELVTVEAGEVHAMAPLLLHASRRATAPAHRRVLHVEYSDARLPGGLSFAE